MNNKIENAFGILVYTDMPFYHIVNEDNERVGCVLTSREEAQIICTWLNNLKES